ncbi:MAG: hypothetical protein M1546_09425, partial [Chloroflexi bacterium]|nr:hypothetical protein [Chloroflexota bacterium]
MYQDGVIKVADLAYSFEAPDKSTVSFKMTKNDVPFDGRNAIGLSIYFVPYAGSKFQFEPAADRLSLKGKLTYDGQGGLTSVITGTQNVGAVDGLIVVFGRNEDVGQLPARVNQTKYPFAALLVTGKGVDYVSPANVSGCEKCHTTPYLKHGYIYGEVGGDAKTDFYTCKACHLDNGIGGHFEWQLAVDNPELWVKYNGGAGEPLTDAQQKQYAYNTTLMNDVHMSHAMEFPYPQSMSNCVTCHEGKLDTVLADANFTVATCKSCHAVTGAKAPVAKEGATPAYDTTKLALKTLMGDKHPQMDLNTTDCTTCHKQGGLAPSFKTIHSGYNKTIYNAAGIKYSDAVSVTIQSATLTDNKLNIKFGAAAKADFKDIDVTKNITPTVMVGLYGWDTKDFIVGPHERSFDDNKDGAIDGKDQRNLEYEVGAQHPRFKTVSAKGGAWEVEADLSAWANLIKDGAVTRVQIGVTPAAVDAANAVVAVSATSRTFDLGANKFDDKAFSPITAAQKCDNCHAALATTFHKPSYGGDVTVCRMCHIVKSGASHLEMQSRSLDSYIHAIHSGQAFDIGDINFADPMQKMHYNEHIEFPFPTHGITDCESCHLKGTFNVPDQSKSLPGLLSASDPIKGWT